MQRGQKMKKDFVRGKLDTGHLLNVKKEFKGYTPASPYAGLVELLADVVDTAISGPECYVTFGLSRDRSSILLTVHYEHSKLYAGGTTLAELSAAAGELI
jgi:hypothetical protein